MRLLWSHAERARCGRIRIRTFRAVCIDNQ